ncbi:MAG: hypothetical protein HQM08_02595 [Candidatus Riflebacteria bacterium]|nr:hypothetical protein [Candidatus Riflebacteria bacterium]
MKINFPNKNLLLFLLLIPAFLPSRILAANPLGNASISRQIVTVPKVNELKALAQPSTNTASINEATIIQGPEKEPSDDSISINFEGVELMSLLRYLSQETGKGFIVDQGLTGNITIISPVRLSRTEALATLESILQVKGFAAIPSGKMYKIVPLAQAKVAGTETRRGNQLEGLSENDTLVTQIIPLSKTGVEEAKNLLTPLLPPDTSIMTYQPSNTLIITGRSINIKRAVEVMTELEKGRVKPGLEIIPIEFSNSAYIKAQLDSLLNVGGLGKGDLKGGIMLFPDPRTNALLVVSAHENMEFIKDLIKKLDKVSNDTRPEITKVIKLKYSDESETIKLVQEILGLGRKNSDSGGGPVASETQAIETTRLLPIRRTKAILVITRSIDIVKRIEKLVRELDCRPPSESSGVQLINLKHADAKTVAETLNNLIQARAKNKTSNAPTTRSDNINFVAVPANNALLVTGTSQLFAQYEPIIKSLDIMRPQIMVEALIAEVSGNLSDSLGIEWGVIDSQKSGLQGFGGTNFGIRSQAVTGQGFQIGLVNGPVDLANIGGVAEYSKIKSLVSLYQNNSDFNILSAPTILSTDNEEAKIMVGEVVALPQGFSKDSISGRMDLTNFKYEDVGVNLTLTPRVNSASIVSLKIDSEVKKRQEENLYQFNVPILTKRKMTTTITLPNHKTIVIGGLVKEDASKVVDKIPFFANIPLIGNAFKNKRNTNQKTNLLVFLTPHILTTPDAVANFDSSKESHSKDDRKEGADKKPGELKSKLEKKYESLKIRAKEVFKDAGIESSEVSSSTAPIVTQNQSFTENGSNAGVGIGPNTEADNPEVSGTEAVTTESDGTDAINTETSNAETTNIEAANTDSAYSQRDL